MSLQGDRSTQVNTIPGVGMTLDTILPPGRFPWQLYTVVAAGPNGEANYTDNRYWLAPAFLLQADSDTDTAKANPQIEDGDAGTDDRITATNIEESATGTHSLAVGTFVWVMTARGRSTTGNTLLQFVFSSGASDSALFVLVKQNGTSGGNPIYDIYELADTGYVTKLNLSGAIAPKCSRARLNAGLTITAATDGSVGIAYYDVSNVVQLFDCQETLCSSADGTY